MIRRLYRISLSSHWICGNSDIRHVSIAYMQILCTLYYDVTTLANVPVLIIILQKMIDPEQKGHPSVMVSAQFVATVFQRVAVVSS